MDFDVPIFLEETSPAGCLMQSGRLYRLSREVVNALLLQSGAVELITASFSVAYLGRRYQLICGFNPSRIENITATWLEYGYSRTFGPLQSWGLIGRHLNDEGHNKNAATKLNRRSVLMSLGLVSDELVISCSILWDKVVG